MPEEEQVYRELQQHLDRQAVGFPATASGVEITILKDFFTPEQARLALHLDYRPRTAGEIAGRAGAGGLSREDVEGMLKEMVGKGAIGVMEKEGVACYYTMPLLVGMIEWHSGAVTPGFAAAFGEYVAGEFGRAFAGTRVSQMRTIPVEESIEAEHHVTTYDHIREIINATEGPIAVNPCICRQGAKGRGDPCHKTDRLETCMTFGDWARHFIDSGGSREITREEALEIMRRNEQDGLVLQPTNYKKIDFVCACCGCCCGILRIQKALPRPAVNWAHNYYAEVAAEDCAACETCVERCQVNAIAVDQASGHAVVDLERCIGCGNCVVTCPSGALRLVKVAEETAPPEDRTSLYALLAERDA